MAKIKVTLNNEKIAYLAAHLSKMAAGEVLPNTAEAFARCAKIVQDKWRAYAQGAGNIEGVTPLKNPSGGLARSIVLKQVSAFNWHIIGASPLHRYIEYGTEQLDMKQTHPYGDRARVAKKKGPNGETRFVPYVVIPFRWGTPAKGGASRSHFANTMDSIVYGISKSMKMSSATGELKVEKNFWGDAVQRASYNWGDRLSSSNGVFGNAEGMVRMQGGDLKSSGYFTFRIISADSPASSWIKPATQGKRITEYLAMWSSPFVNEEVKKAVEADLL